MTARSRSRSRPGTLSSGLLFRPEPLRWHALAAASAATAAMIANLLLAPDRLWAPWLAAGLAAALGVHGALVLAGALRPATPAASSQAIDAATHRAEPAPRVDPGPPIFPDDPADTRTRRWVPRQPDGPAPAPRIAAAPAARLHPLPAAPAMGVDVEMPAPRPTPAWPSWEPGAAPVRAVADIRWPADAAVSGERRVEHESAAGW